MMHIERKKLLGFSSFGIIAAFHNCARFGKYFTHTGRYCRASWWWANITPLPPVPTYAPPTSAPPTENPDRDGDGVPNHMGSLP